VQAENENNQKEAEVAKQKDIIARLKREIDQLNDNIKKCDLTAPAGNLRLPQALTRKDRVSGVILSGTHSVSILSALRELRIPFSLLGNNIIGNWRSEDYDCVATDDVRGATEITQHLISMGHRTIWFIGVKERSSLTA